MLSRKNLIAAVGLRYSIIASLLVQIFVPSVAQADTFHPTRFTVTVEGKGPNVILIPGLASSISVWQPEAEKLKAHYRVYLIQVNGFAGTYAGANSDGPIIVPLVEELARYIETNGLKQPAVIGHSLGGLMALMLADKHPEDVSKLMIVDSLPFYGMMFGPTATVAGITPQASAMRDSILAETQATYAASEPMAMARLIKSKGEDAQRAIAAAVASDHSIVARAIYEDFTTDLRSDLPKIKTPIVMLYPFDVATGMTQAMFDALYQGAYASLPNKRITRIDNSFHYIQIDQPEIFDREVQGFLSQQ